MITPFRKLLLVLPVILGAGTPFLRAQTTWSGPGSDFNTAGNWSSGLPSAASAANFGGATPLGIDISGAITALGLNFTAGGYSFASANSSVLSVGANGIDAAASLGTITFANATTLSAASTSAIGAGTTIDSTGRVTLGAAGIFEKSGSGTWTIGGTGSEGFAYGVTTGSVLSVTEGVLNLNRAVGAAASMPASVLAIGNGGTVNIQAPNQFGGAFAQTIRLSGSAVFNVASSGALTRLQSFVFGAAADGSQTAGGGAVTIGLTGGNAPVIGSSIIYNPVEATGTQATISGGQLSLRNNQFNSFSIGNSSNTHKELVISSLVTSGSGSTTLTKSGAGTLELSGANTMEYLNFVVSAGTLLINNSGSTWGVGTSAVQVNTDAVLGGTGRLAPGSGDSIVFLAGGRLSPGDVNASTGATEIESLSFVLTGASKLDLTLGALYTFDLGSTATAGTTYDTVGVTGTVDFGATTLQFSDFTFNQRAGFGTGSYTLFSSTLLSGTIASGFDSGSMGGGFTGTLFVSGNDLVLNVVPEPSTVAMLLSGFGILHLRRRRR